MTEVRGYQPKNGEHVRVIGYDDGHGKVRIEPVVGQTGRARWQTYEGSRWLHIRFDTPFYDSTPEKDEETWEALQDLAKDPMYEGLGKGHKRENLGYVSAISFTGGGWVQVEKVEDGT